MRAPVWVEFIGASIVALVRYHAMNSHRDPIDLPSFCPSQLCFSLGSYQDWINKRTLICQKHTKLHLHPKTNIDRKVTQKESESKLRKHVQSTEFICDLDQKPPSFPVTICFPCTLPFYSLRCEPKLSFSPRGYSVSSFSRPGDNLRHFPRARHA